MITHLKLIVLACLTLCIINQTAHTLEIDLESERRATDYAYIGDTNTTAIKDAKSEIADAGFAKVLEVAKVYCAALISSTTYVPVGEFGYDSTETCITREVRNASRRIMQLAWQPLKTQAPTTPAIPQTIPNTQLCNSEFGCTTSPNTTPLPVTNLDYSTQGEFPTRNCPIRTMPECSQGSQAVKGPNDSMGCPGAYTCKAMVEFPSKPICPTKPVCTSNSTAVLQSTDEYGCSRFICQLNTLPPIGSGEF